MSDIPPLSAVGPVIKTVKIKKESASEKRKSIKKSTPKLPEQQQAPAQHIDEVV